MPLTREEALRVPVVARARGLICNTIARLPMAVHNTAGPLATQPTWLDRSDGALPPWKRTALVVEDLLFHGWALLQVERGADSWPSRVEYVPYTRWEFDGDDRVTIDGQRARPGSVALIPGPHEGVLTFGAQAIRAAADLAATAARAAATPIPNIELHDTGTRPLTDEQIKKLVSDWVAARQGKNGGVAYTNASIELRAHGSQSADLLVAGRNAAAVDVARVMGVPAALLDATAASASLTYETTAGRNAEFVEYGLAPYLSAICARLGMDDMTPRGNHVDIDLPGFTSLGEPAALVPDDGARLQPAPDPIPLRSVNR